MFGHRIMALFVVYLIPIDARFPSWGVAHSIQSSIIMPGGRQALEIVGCSSKGVLGRREGILRRLVRHSLLCPFKQ